MPVRITKNVGGRVNITKQAGIGRVNFAVNPPSSIVSSGLILNLDAGNSTSYPGTGTTWSDISGNGNNFTLVNSPTFISNGAASTFDFTASSFQHASSNSSINLQRNFTLEAWVNFSSFGGSLRGFFGQGTANAYQAIAIFINSNRLLYSMYFSDLDITASFSTNVWYHMVFTYNHASPFQKQIYRNGTLLAESSSGQNQYNGSGILRVGAPYGNLNQEMMQGKISIARAYSKILSAAEVLQNYNADKSRFGL